MKCGFARVCINPDLGTPIMGYYEERYTKGILDDIYATAVALCDGESKALIISVETCEL